MESGPWNFAMKHLVCIEADEEQVHPMKVAIHEARRFAKVALRLKAFDPTILNHQPIDSERRQHRNGHSCAHDPPAITRYCLGQPRKCGFGWGDGWRLSPRAYG